MVTAMRDLAENKNMHVNIRIGCNEQSRLFAVSIKHCSRMTSSISVNDSTGKISRKKFKLRAQGSFLK